MAVAWLDELPREADVCVDVRAAREVHDAAVAALARGGSRRGGRIMGLSRHQATLLSCFGGRPSSGSP